MEHLEKHVIRKANVIHRAIIETLEEKEAHSKAQIERNEELEFIIIVKNQSKLQSLEVVDTMKYQKQFCVRFS